MHMSMHGYNILNICGEWKIKTELIVQYRESWQTSCITTTGFNTRNYTLQEEKWCWVYIPDTKTHIHIDK